MQQTAKTFQKWPNELAEKITEKDRNDRKVWIVPATFYTMLISNGGR